MIIIDRYDCIKVIDTRYELSDLNSGATVQERVDSKICKHSADIRAGR